MDDKRTDRSLERFIEFLEHGKQISEEEMAQLMESEEEMHIYKDLINCKLAVMQEYAYDATDSDKEWHHFLQRKRRRPIHFLWGVAAGIAVSVLFVLMFSWWKTNFSQKQELLVFQAADDQQQVLLQTSAGNQIVLERNTHNDELEAVGTALENTDTLKLTYLANTRKIETHLLSTPRGQDFKVVLADGTTVWLNAESRLEYPSQFTGKKRVVNLQGEAYFEVAKDAARPFIIHTEHMKARVLGTELNIRDYATHDSHVTLIEGSVEVSSRHADSFTKLMPGEDAHLRENGSFSVKEVDVDTYLYWREGYLYFDDVPLVDVMQSLGRWYNINVVFNNKKAMKLRMHYFCNRNETLEQALTLLNRMGKLNTKLIDNTVYVE